MTTERLVTYLDLLLLSPESGSLLSEDARHQPEMESLERLTDPALDSLLTRDIKRYPNRASFLSTPCLVLGCHTPYFLDQHLLAAPGYDKALLQNIPLAARYQISWWFQSTPEGDDGKPGMT